MKVLFIGSKPPPNHGQSIAFASAMNAMNDDVNCKVINTSFRGGSFLDVVVKIVQYYISVPFQLFLYRPDKVYFLCSRSFVGGMRDVYLLALCRFSKCEVMNHLHGSDFDSYIKSLGKLYKKIVVYMYKRVDRHAVLIDGMQNELKLVADTKDVVVIDNFFQDSVEITKNINLRTFDDGLKILYLSSIVSSKGVFELIEAVKQSVLNNRSVKLVVAGGFIGDEYLDAVKTERKFMALIEKCDEIDYAGVVSTDEKYKLLANADVLALPSYYKSEAIPLCIIEAMRMGCCILATNYKYLPSLVKEDVNGFLVKPKSIKDIVSKLEALCIDKGIIKIISKHNIAEAMKKYCETTYQNKIRDFIRGEKC